jgi:hypothetical protein
VTNRARVRFEGGPWDGRDEIVQIPLPAVLSVPDMPAIKWWQVWLPDTEPIRPPVRYFLVDGVYRAS